MLVPCFNEHHYFFPFWVTRRIYGKPMRENSEPFPRELTRETLGPRVSLSARALQTWLQLKKVKDKDREACARRLRGTVPARVSPA